MVDKLFSLRYRMSDGTSITITAIHTGRYDARGTSRITVQVRHNGRTVWEPDATWCHPGPSHADDSECVKELVTSLVALKPGDTDEEAYTAEQLALAGRYGEELTMQAWERYGEP